MSGDIPTAIAIAGSDSGGGAGIQADLKAFARCGVHGTSAITAVTVQNTAGVTAVHPIPPEIIVAQVTAVAEDIGVDAAKVGMLGDEQTIDAAQTALAFLRGSGDPPVVIDPVMVAESGASLLEPSARRALVRKLFGFATVVTPNVPEARELSGLGEGAPQEELARVVHALAGPGPDVVVVTGGHTEAGADLFFDGARAVEIEGPRHPEGASHGSGCTHSSVLAAQLALGRTPLEAARAAREIAAEAVGAGLRDLGEGAGPVDVLGLEKQRP